MRLRKSAVAEQDILAILDYIAQDNPDAADRFWQRLNVRFQSLLKTPYIGESQDRFRAGLRSALEGNHIIFYEPRAEEIVIYRVIHAARNGKTLLAS